VSGKAAVRRRSRQRARVEPLELPVRRAIRRFVRLLAWSGCAPEAVEKEVAEACRGIPKSWSFAPDSRHAGDAGHVLTLWFADPAYLGARGQPRPLPLRGPALSLETLTHRVDPGLDVRYVLRYLKDGGAVKQVGERYVPQDRVVIFRDRSHTTASIAGLFGLLSTLEHNQWAGKRSPRRVQQFVRNPHLPVSAVVPFQARVRKFLHRLLVQFDAELHRREKTRKKGERTVRMGVGVYQFEEDAPTGRESPRPANRRRHKGRAR
jgi:hypothetical protein